jgi:hypothetical protein
MGRHKNGACFGRAPVLGPRLTCGKSHSENRGGEASSTSQAQDGLQQVN